MVQKIASATLIFISVVVILRFWTLLLLNGWFDNLKIDYNVVPVDVFDIMITSAVTIWIGYYVVKTLSEQRFEKEMLISDLREIEAKTSELEAIFEQSNQIDITLVSSKLNAIHHSLDRFKHTIKLSTSKYDTEIREIDAAFNSLFISTTDFGSNIIRQDVVDMPAISTNINRVILKVRETVIRINKK